MTEADKRELLTALSMRMAYIETGNPALRASDVREQLARGGLDSFSRSLLKQTVEMRVLSEDQHRLIRHLEDLWKRIAEAKVLP